MEFKPFHFESGLWFRMVNNEYDLLHLIYVVGNNYNILNAHESKIEELDGLVFFGFRGVKSSVKLSDHLGTGEMSVSDIEDMIVNEFRGK